MDESKSTVPGPHPPQPERPDMPDGYGLLAGTQRPLAWNWVESRLLEARNYWIATSRPDGRPHVVPVWGIWCKQGLYFGTDRASRKAQNLAGNANAAIHLESGDEVVILEGTVEEIRASVLLTTIDALYLEKYGMRLTDAPGDLVVYRLRPTKALAWEETSFPSTATRWRFQQST